MSIKLTQVQTHWSDSSDDNNLYEECLYTKLRHNSMRIILRQWGFYKKDDTYENSRYLVLKVQISFTYFYVKIKIQNPYNR